MCSPVAVAVADSTADDAFLGCNLLERSHCKQIHSFSCEEKEESGLPRMTRPEDGIGMWVQLTTSMQTPKPVEQTRFTRIQYCTVTKDLATLNSTIKPGFFDPFPCLPTFRDAEFTSWLSN